MSTIVLTGEANDVLVFPITLGALVNGTTITSAILRARAPGGGPFLDWVAALELPTLTSIVLTYAIPAQLAEGLWTVRPLIYVGASLVTSARLASQQFRVRPDAIPAT